MTGRKYVPPPQGVLGSCPQCGKWRFLTKSAAKTEARRKLTQCGPPLNRPYKCSGYWHLTSEPRSAAAGYRERQRA